MGGKILFAIIPLILSIGIVSTLQFSEAEKTQICIDKVWMENTRGKIACVTPSTAEKLVERGWGTILAEDVFDKKPKMFEPGMKQNTIDYEKELSLLPEHFGGVGPMTVTPFIGELTKSYPEFYVPGTEELDEDEMRIYACGTGSPWIVKSQSASCFLIQTGAGHNLLFEIGGGSIGNLNALGLAADDLTDIFVSHLHVDHIGDFDMFWGQGFMWGRTIPVTLHGPSGPTPELGTEYFAEHFLKTWTWDLESKRGTANSAWHKINVNQFAYSEKNQVVYEKNGLTVTAFPAVHGIDGAVSYRLDWNEMSVVYSGDTVVNKYILENSKDVDVFILQVFPSAETISKMYNVSLELAEFLLEHAHISPEGAGVLLQLTQPRVPLIFHMNLFEPEIVPDAISIIREYYDKPLAVAQDLTTVNLTPDYAIIRQAQVDPALRSTSPQAEPDEEAIHHMSDWLNEARIPIDELKKKLQEGE